MRYGITNITLHLFNVKLLRFQAFTSVNNPFTFRSRLGITQVMLHYRQSNAVFKRIKSKFDRDLLKRGWLFDQIHSKLNVHTLTLILLTGSFKKEGFTIIAVFFNLIFSFQNLTSRICLQTRWSINYCTRNINI